MGAYSKGSNLLLDKYIPGPESNSTLTHTSSLHLNLSLIPTTTFGLGFCMCSLNATHLKGSKAKLGMPEPARVCTIDGSPVDFNIFKGDCETFHCT